MSASALSDIELTILTLVAEGSRFGAEIEQLIELRGLREWLTVGSASVYYILGRLEQQELISSTLPGGDADVSRTVYQITEAGRGVAQTAIADLLCQPRVLGEGFALGLANSSILKPSQVALALTQHRESLTSQLHAAQALWERRQHEAVAPTDNIRALFTHGIAMMQAELDWLTAFIEDWRVRHPVIDDDPVSVSVDDSAAAGQARTILHHPTDSLDRGKQIQQIRRPISSPLEKPREE